MKIAKDTNYCLLSNAIDETLLANFSEYNVVDDKITYSKLEELISNFINKTIVFNETWHILNNKQKGKIMELLKLRNVNFINITSNIEDALFCDYIYVYDKDNIVMEGSKDAVLKEEKILKRLGYGLPFVIDLSLQLNYYNILDEVYYDMESLVHDLWN